jgi:hypothetical protein
MCKPCLPGSWARRILGPALGLTLILTVSSISLVGHAALPIKWVDEQGVVHYGDRASAEGGVRSSAAARESRSASAPPQPGTPGKAAEMSPPAPVPADQQRRDRVLLDSYSSVLEIDRARERTTSSIQGELDAAQRTLGQLRTRRAELLEKSKPTSGAKPAPATAAELGQVDDLITHELRFVSLKTDQLQKAAARYDTDRRRWQEINGDVASR